MEMSDNRNQKCLSSNVYQVPIYQGNAEIINLMEQDVRQKTGTFYGLKNRKRPI